MTMPDSQRIVITGIGVVSPCGSSLAELRQNILAGKSGIRSHDVLYMGKKPAGVCEFEEFKYQTKKLRMRGTRAGSLAIYASNECVAHSGINWEAVNKDRLGLFVGIAEHGSIELEKEFLYFYEKKEIKISHWSPMHNYKIIANSPASEVAIYLKITGPHMTLGGACSASNLAIYQGVQQMRQGDIDYALVGGVSESVSGFGLFASFEAQAILADQDDKTIASRPLDTKRNGIVISEGCGFFMLERLSDAKKRNAKIYAEIIAGSHTSDAHEILLPSSEAQIKCMQIALEKANLKTDDIDLLNMHATGTVQGDIQECAALEKLFGANPTTHFNSTKAHLGHVMGAAGILEIAANISCFDDQIVHNSIHIDRLDSKCNLKNLVYQGNKKLDKPIKYFLKNSFGMMGINSTLIFKNGNLV